MKPKDNLKFLSILFLILARSCGKKTITFPNSPFEFDGKSYVAAGVGSDQSLTLYSGHGKTLTDFLTVTGEEDWPDGIWDDIFRGLYVSTLRQTQDTNDDIDDMLAMMDQVFNQGKTVGESRPKSSRYIVVEWPDSQALMGLDGFSENAYLVDDEQGLEDFGSSAYFVDEEWLEQNT